MHEHSVVVTGLGPVTAFGLGMEPLWRALVDGRSAIGLLARYDASAFPCPFGAEIGEAVFNVRDLVPKSYRKATKVMARDIELAVGAAKAAVEDAGLTTRGVDPDAQPTITPQRFGCHIGAGLIAADVDELTLALSSSVDENGAFDLKKWGTSGMQNLTPLWLLKYLPNMLACHVTIIHDCRGPSNTITCAEASGALSMGESMRVIERGQADACLTGGAEDKLNHMGVLRQHFAKRLAQARVEDDPTSIVRPFDAEAKGCVLGEGGAILVLESQEAAAARGAQPYARAAGFASTQSFCPDTVGIEIEPDDEGLSDAIEIALEDAEIGAGEIDAIVPMGSSIPSVDAAEAAAISRVFGRRAAEIPIVTTTPNVGNCCAGAGAINLCAAAKIIREQRLPARLNAKRSAVLNAEACESSSAKIGAVLAFTPSFGGQNAAVVFTRA